jgi:peroxiredoxin
MNTSTHQHPQPGLPAPDFRLHAAGGGEIALSDYRGRRKLLLWFSKGLFCPYCKRNMVRLSQGYAEIRARDAEVLQITHNTAEEADLYFRNYRLAMPYLCDADRAVHLRYGIPLEHQSIAAVVDNVVKSGTMVTADLLLRGDISPVPVVPIMRMGARNQSPQLVVVVDLEGVVRRVHPIGPFDALPSREELIGMLDSLGATPAAQAASGVPS